MLQSQQFLLALFAKALCKTLFDLCLISDLHLQHSMAVSFSLKKTAVKREIHDDKVWLTTKMPIIFHLPSYSVFQNPSMGHFSNNGFEMKENEISNW